MPTKVKISLPGQNWGTLASLHASICPKRDTKANVRLKMLEAETLGARSPAAGEMLAAVVNLPPQPLLCQLLPPLLANSSVKSLEIHAGTLRHFSSLGFMEAPVSQDQPWTVKRGSSGDSWSLSEGHGDGGVRAGCDQGPWALPREDSVGRIRPRVAQCLLRLLCCYAKSLQEWKRSG